MKLCLGNRQFKVKQGEEITPLVAIGCGVRRGNVLDPVLYLLYTANLPTSRNTTVANTIVASHENSIIATRLLQPNLDQNQLWLQK